MRFPATVPIHFIRCPSRPRTRLRRSFCSCHGPRPQGRDLPPPLLFASDPVAAKRVLTAGLAQRPASSAAGDPGPGRSRRGSAGAATRARSNAKVALFGGPQRYPVFSWRDGKKRGGRAFRESALEEGIPRSAERVGNRTTAFQDSWRAIQHDGTEMNVSGASGSQNPFDRAEGPGFPSGDGNGEVCHRYFGTP